MTAAFVLAAGALALLVAAFVLRPLWRQARAVVVVLAAGMLVAGTLLYLLVGTPAALDPQARRAPESLGDAIAQLEAELAREPQQAEGWRLLGRAYSAQGRAADARDAFAEAARLLPDDPDALVEAAEARAMAMADRRLDEQAIALLDRALQLQPQHQRALWFRGIAHRQAGAAAAAARTWELLLALVAADTANTLRVQVDAARADAGLPLLPVPAATTTGIAVTVTLAPSLAGRLPPDATLYVIAREPGGPPMPVAVERLPAQGFPLDVVLDDGDSPMPTRRLSQLAQVELVARISASGDATARTGDLTSMPVVIASDETNAIVISIDDVVE